MKPRLPAFGHGVSAIFHYLGPSFAVPLFTRVDVLGVALWRSPWRSVAALAASS